MKNTFTVFLAVMLLLCMVIPASAAVIDFSSYTLEELQQIEQELQEEIRTRQAAAEQDTGTADDDSELAISITKPINETGYVQAIGWYDTKDPVFLVLCDDGRIYDIYRHEYTKWTNMVSLQCSTGTSAAFGINDQGKVILLVKEFSWELKFWDEIEEWPPVKIAAISETHAVALTRDGKLVSAGDYRNKECDVDDWTDIVDLQVGENFTVGLKADGTVVATGKNNYGQCNVKGWTDIVAIATGNQHTVGLRADGTVVATGRDNNNQCYTGRWKKVVRICAVGGILDEITVGITEDGQILYTSAKDFGTRIPKDYRCKNAVDIIDIFLDGGSGGYCLGLIEADGTYRLWGENTAYWGNPVSKTMNLEITPKTEYTIDECAYAAVDYLKAHLKNPSSYQQHSINYYKTDDNTYMITIDYSAMNGFGGYNRSTFVCTVDIKTGKVISAH